MTSDDKGPDLGSGIELSRLPDGVMLAGHFHNEALMLVNGGGQFRALASKCTHMGAPLNEGVLIDDENPYELSDGLRWYLLDAAEEKPGAPINIGLGKTTVASVNVDATGSIRMKKASDNNGATRTLTRSLDSRRRSTNSKKGIVAIAANSASVEGMTEGPR